jgi:3-oxoacyl-[acyl-carrier protein] reductase
MDLGIAGKIALVTAASQGLGKASAIALAREEAQVVICARRAAQLQAAADEIRAASNLSVAAYECDLDSAHDIEAMMSQVIATFGTVHIVVNNAGGPAAGGFDQLTDPDWQRAFDRTLMSAVRVTRAALPHMRKQRWGRIVNIASYSVKHPIPDIMLSNSLRLAVAGWAKTLATEVAADNVLINTIGPGWTRTDRVSQMLDARAEAQSQTPQQVEARLIAGIPLGRLAAPAEIAAVVAFLASERASYITGTMLAVDGGVVASPV